MDFLSLIFIVVSTIDFPKLSISYSALPVFESLFPFREYYYFSPESDLSKIKKSTYGNPSHVWPLFDPDITVCDGK